MKINNCLYLLLAGIFCLASCYEDDVIYVAPERIEVVKADLNFKSAGGTGSAELAVKSASLQVTSSVDWCTATISAGIVTATVTENTGIESRVGTVTVTDGKLSAELMVYQEGLVFQIDVDGFRQAWTYEPASTTFAVKCTSPYTVTVSAGDETWVTCTPDQNHKVKVDLAKNTTGAFRAATITITSGNIQKQLRLCQYELADLLGKWAVDYFDGEAQLKDWVTIAKDSENPDDNNLTVNLFSYTPIKATYTNGEIRIPFGQQVDTFMGYKLIFAAYDIDSYPVTGSAYSASLAVFLTDDSKLGMRLVDNGSWGWAIDTPAILALNSSGTVAGYWELLLDFIMTK